MAWGQATGVTKRAHARSACRLDPRRAVFNHRTGTGLDAHATGHVFEEIRSWLRPGDIRHAENPAVKAFEQADEPEAIADLFVRAARSHACQERDGIERVDCPINRLKLG